MRNGHHTGTQTDGHRDSMTDPAQRAESVKIIPRCLKLYIYIKKKLQTGNTESFDVCGY